MSHTIDRTAPSASDSASWDVRFQQALARASRVLKFSDIQQLALNERPNIAESTTRSLVEDLVAVGGLRRVNAGLYLNRRATPPAEPEEAAQHVRSGAVVSLQSVLGAVGAHNNRPAVVMAVVPVLPGQRLNLGAVPPRPKEGDDESQQQLARWGVHFHFYPLPEHFFPKTPADAEGVLVRGARCPTFTPEASLLQWLHISLQPRSRLTPPAAGDISFIAADSSLANRGLRRDKLESLAARWEMSTALRSWLASYDAQPRGDEAEEEHQVLQAPRRRLRP